MISVRLIYDSPSGESISRVMDFEDATRISTDEHNNLEVWAGADGDRLLYVCAATNWIDVTIEGETDGTD